MTTATNVARARSQATNLLAAAAVRAAAGRYDEARKMIYAVVAAAPACGPAWNVLGSVCFMEGNLLGAAVAVQQCLRHDPDNAIAHATYGELALRAGAKRTATTHLAEAIARKDKLSGRLQQWVQLLASRAAA